MKNYFYVPIIVLLSFSVPMILIAADKQLSSQNLSGRINAFAAVKVVELFSSESCYDCPKADMASC